MDKDLDSSLSEVERIKKEYEECLERVEKLEESWREKNKQLDDKATLDLRKLFAPPKTEDALAKADQDE